MPGPKEKETEFLDQGNLINVSTQNNFCGYYVLARRIIHDDNFSPELIRLFNQFYSMSWDKGKLATVLNNMHPAQAEVMLGLVLRHKYVLATVNEGLEPYELNELCQLFAYNLFIYQLDFDHQQTIDQCLFTSFQEYSQDNKKIFVLFKPPSRQTSSELGPNISRYPVELGHYYLFEPDNLKAAKDAGLRGANAKHKYHINNQGNTEIFINNIKESVVEIDQQLNHSSVNEAGDTSLSVPLLSANNKRLKKSLSSSQESIKLSGSQVAPAEKDLSIKHDEYYAWQLAFEEAERITSENSVKKGALNNFKYLFFSEKYSVKLTDQQLTEQKNIKSYVVDLQRKEIEYCEKLKSKNSQLDLNETTNAKKEIAVSRR